MVYRDRSKVITEAKGKALLVGPRPNESTLKYTFDPSAIAIADLQPGDQRGGRPGGPGGR